VCRDSLRGLNWPRRKPCPARLVEACGSSVRKRSTVFWFPLTAPIELSEVRVCMNDARPHRVAIPVTGENFFDVANSRKIPAMHNVGRCLVIVPVIERIKRF
jgi:hypothetical protein